MKSSLLVDIYYPMVRESIRFLQALDPPLDLQLTPHCTHKSAACGIDQVRSMHYAPQPRSIHIRGHWHPSPLLTQDRYRTGLPIRFTACISILPRFRFLSKSTPQKQPLLSSSSNRSTQV